MVSPGALSHATRNVLGSGGPSRGTNNGIVHVCLLGKFRCDIGRCQQGNGARNHSEVKQLNFMLADLRLRMCESSLSRAQVHKQ